MSVPKKPKRQRKTKAEAAPQNRKPSGVGSEATQWKPGQSGNPGGRPRIVGEIRALARENTLVAMDTLVEVCTDKEAPQAARVAAAAHILDRGYGKPTQHVSQTVRHVQKMTDDELLAYLSGADEADGSEGVASEAGDPGKPH